MGGERRKYKRFDTMIEGSFASEDGLLAGICKTDNFSREGCCLSLNRHVQNNSIIKLEFRYPNSIMLFFASGRVVWSRRLMDEATMGFKAGVFWWDFDEVERKRVLDHCFQEWEKARKQPVYKEEPLDL